MHSPAEREPVSTSWHFKNKHSNPRQLSPEKDESRLSSDHNEVPAKQQHQQQQHQQQQHQQQQHQQQVTPPHSSARSLAFSVDSLLSQPSTSPRPEAPTSDDENSSSPGARKPSSRSPRLAESSPASVPTFSVDGLLSKTGSSPYHPDAASRNPEQLATKSPEERLLSSEHHVAGWQAAAGMYYPYWTASALSPGSSKYRSRSGAFFDIDQEYDVFVVSINAESTGNVVICRVLLDLYIERCMEISE